MGGIGFPKEMKNSITFKQYRAIDLTILSVFLILSEGLTTVATTKWFVAVPFAISTTLAFLCIGMMRWGIHSWILALIGGATYGLTFVISSGEDPKKCLIYVIGNLLSLLAIPFIKLIGKNKLRQSNLLLLSYAVLTYLLVCVGRWMVSLIFEVSLSSLLAFIGPDVITLLFTAVLLTVVKSVDGLIEDQHDYILRQAKEREDEERKDAQRLHEVYDDPDYLDGVLDEEEQNNDLIN